MILRQKMSSRRLLRRRSKDFPPAAGCGRAENLTIDLLKKLEMKKK
jgi:hypothetical protein